MSAIHEYEYRQQRRRREYLDRIRGNTQRFAERYSGVLHDIRQQGLDQFVPKEFRQLEQELQRLNSLLQTNPEEARTLSMALGDEVYGLRRLARQARNQFERQQQFELQRQYEAEQQRQQQAEQRWYEIVNSYEDFVVRDFAMDSLLQLQQEYLQLSEEELDLRLDQIRRVAEQQAVEWKASQQEANQADNQLEILELQQLEIQQDLQESPGQLQEVLKNLQNSREFLAQGGRIEPASFQQTLTEQIQQADEAITDERCRRLTVQGIVKSLIEQGFQLIQPPQLFRDQQRDEVVIQARRLSGRSSEFRVSLDGGFRYKFEHYEGMACKDDIETILPKLQEIYGIELTEKKVIWENPDRNLRSARSMDDPQEQQNDR